MVLLVALLGADVVYFEKTARTAPTKLPCSRGAVRRGTRMVAEPLTQIRDAIAHSIGTATEAILIFCSS